MFKLTNGLIHLTNVYLVFWLVLRLLRRAPLAAPPLATSWHVALGAFAAGVFAVHPLVVESVTWVPGREELLMTLGALACIHCHLTAHRLGEDGLRRRTGLACQAGAVFWCAVACLSNAVGAVVPLLITAMDIVYLDRPKLWRIVRSTSTLWMIGFATVVVKKMGPTADVAMEQVGLTIPERFMVVLNVYSLNLKTVFWPTELGLFYDSCSPASFLEAGVVLGGIAILLSCALLWRLRRRKTVLFGLLWFVVALAPASQIMPHHIHRADRFMYFPLVGLSLAAAIALRPAAVSLRGRSAVIGACVAGILPLFALAVLSAYQVHTWRSGLAVWSNSLSVNPKNSVAHWRFAANLVRAGQFDRAVFHFKMAIALKPEDVVKLDSLARLLATHGEAEARDYPTACRLTERACQLTEWKDSTILEGFALIHGNFAQELVAHGEFRQAIMHYEEVIRVRPSDKMAVFNLAWVLATCPDETLRNPNKAVRLAETPWEATGHDEVLRLKVLAAAYAEAGQRDAAVETVADAIREAEAAGDAALAEEFRSQLEQYRNEPKTKSLVPQQTR